MIISTFSLWIASAFACNEHVIQKQIDWIAHLKTVNNSELKVAMEEIELHELKYCAGQLSTSDYCDDGEKLYESAISLTEKKIQSKEATINDMSEVAAKRNTLHVICN